MNCTFQPRGDKVECIHCGQRFKRPVLIACEKRPRIAIQAEPRPKRPTALDCEHLGSATGENGKVLNCGCGAMSRLYRCDLLDKACAPIPTTARAKMEDESIVLCRDCQHNPANAPPADVDTKPVDG